MTLLWLGIEHKLNGTHNLASTAIAMLWNILKKHRPMFGCHNPYRDNSFRGIHTGGIITWAVEYLELNRADILKTLFIILRFH